LLEKLQLIILYRALLCRHVARQFISEKRYIGSVNNPINRCENRQSKIDPD